MYKLNHISRVNVVIEQQTQSESEYQLCLTRKLSRWYRGIDGDAGFTKESFKALESKIQSATNPLFFALVIDEMAIREQSEFTGDEYVGHVTLGAGKGDDTFPLAKEAFVLLVVCINDCWKLPIGYFLTSGIKEKI